MKTIKTRKTSTILAVLLMLSMFCITLSACSETGKPNKNNNGRGGIIKESSMPDNNGQDGIIKESSMTDKPNVPAPSNPIVYPDAAKLYTTANNLASIGQTVEYEGISYIIHNALFTKELGGRDMSRINYFNEERDANGTLTGTNTYVFFSITIKNVSDHKIEELVNHPFMLVSKEDYRIAEVGAESRGIDKPQSGQSIMNAHHFNLQPGEETSFEETYIIDDEYVTDELYFLLGFNQFTDNNGKKVMDDPRNRYIQIGSEARR